MKKFDKKGAMNPAVSAIIGIVVIILLIVGGVLLIGFLKENGVNMLKSDGLTPAKYAEDSVKMGDAIGKPAFNALSYVFGEVPTALVGASSPSGSIIVIIAVFTILLLMFGDILETFGSFSNPVIAWIIAAALTLIAANMKLIMMFSAIGFTLVSGIGAFAAVLGVLIPFVMFIFLRLLFLGNLKRFMDRRKTGMKIDDNIDEFDKGFKGVRKLSQSMQGN
jgi:hypothetical protein